MPAAVAKKLELIEVTKLLLDNHNYRFVEDMREASQEDLARKLDQDFDPLPIGRSIVENGYFAEEPLVVFPKPPDFVVVEGNRRLVALKFLLDEKLRRISKDREKWEELAQCVKREDVLKVPVVVYKTREELAPMLGFRHIAGIEKWSPLAKAKYINSLVEELMRKRGKATFEEVAQRTGTYGEETVLNYYTTYRAYLQARDEFQTDVSQVEKEFSLFYRIFARYTKMQKFIGLHKRKSPVELQRPIPPQYADKLEELIEYIYGTQKEPAVIRESREMGRLADVLDNRSALKCLRETHDLNRAHELVTGEKPVILKYLREAGYYLDEVLKSISKYKDDLIVKEAMKQCHKKFSQILKHFPELTKEKEE
jgi:hypothetical protein